MLIRQVRQRAKRRAVIVVQVAVLMVVLLGFAVLTVDVGAMYNTRADIQRAADSAALAAAAMLATPGEEVALEEARSAALSYTQQNPVFGRQLTLDSQDVVFGRVTFGESGVPGFQPTNFMPDAVSIRVRHTADSSNGAVPLFFARIFGMDSTDMSAGAVAMMIPRDISLVIDLSASHNDDSELRNLGVTEINLFDVWRNIPVTSGVNGVGDGVTAPPPGDPFNPAPAPTNGLITPGDGGNDPGSAPWGGQLGATFGRMYYWGDSLSDSYDATADSGLAYLPRYQTWTDRDVMMTFAQTGYSRSEVTAMSSNYADAVGGRTGHWNNRVAVALGLARWDSGMAGGLAERLDGNVPTNPGNGDSVVDADELTWLVDYPYPGGSWSEFIHDYVGQNNSAMVQAHSEFRYRFGLKTFTNYLMERRYRGEDTPDLANTPHQPMHAVSEAVNHMVEMIMELESDDQLSLESYGTWGRHEVDLTRFHELVSDRMSTLQAGHYDPWTNVGGGLDAALAELTGQRARQNAVKMIILLTDGNANVDQVGTTGNGSDGAAWAIDRAQAAAAANIRIFAVSVGSGANQELMQQIADIGQGEHFHAEGTIEEYSAQLTEIFRTLGGTRPVELIQ
ncbi:MAG: VWA domain-containing protein [Phycisphaerae bacterium]